MSAARADQPGVADAILPQRGAVLAFDYGERRMGVAVGELELKLAHPVETVTSASSVERDKAVDRLVAEWAPVLFVVGLPRHMDGSEHPLGRQCRRFARGLESRFGRPVALVDERLTSHAASLALHDAGVRGRRQKDMLDQVAAQQILQAYFEDSHGAP